MIIRLLGQANGCDPRSHINQHHQDSFRADSCVLVDRSHSRTPTNSGKLLAAIGVALFLTTPNVFAVRQERKIDGWKPTHYNVKIQLSSGLDELTSARTEVTVVILKSGVTTIDLDFADLNVNGVTVDKRRASFTRSNSTLLVKLPKAVRPRTKLIVAIDYRGKPKSGLVMTNDKDGRPSVIGDNWPDRVHHWIPSFDHPSAKATVAFSITAPSDQLVVANGRLANVVNTSGMTRTWNYAQAVPIPPYCMVFAAGQFTKIDAASEITPLSYYVPQSDAAVANKGFSAAAPSLKFFSQTIAPYPYEKLALIVGNTQFGGMENSSAIVFASTIFNSISGTPMSSTFNIRRNLVELVAHEIAHQWFGDSVTEETWSDLWLSEGFATYFAGLLVQNTDGETAFRDYMQDAATTAIRFEKATRIPIHDTETQNLMALLNANNYQKGAWVLHMLRSQLGDEAFFAGLRDYYQQHKDGNATSNDLRTALERASKTNLEEFFARWIYGTGHPIYQLSWTWDAQTKLLRLRLMQTQPEPAFPNWLPVDIFTASGKQRVLLKPTAKETVQELRTNERPSSVQLDPDGTILKEIVMAATTN
jgi:aminopeptidase N